MLISPHIKTPTKNQQFNLGQVTITWEQPDAVDFIEDGSEVWRYDYNVDVDDPAWAEIQSALEDASGENAYGGEEFIQEMFLDPVSKTKAGAPLLDGYSGSIELSDNITVVFIESTYNDSFDFYLVDNETGDRYHITSSGPDYDIVIDLVSESEVLDTSQLTYDLEYTDNYDGENTTWSTIKRRIPLSNTSYTWTTGKMIKSNKVRIRMRTKYLITEESSEWSLSSVFAINVFSLIAPSIISPISDVLYSDFIIIILNESEIINTFNQKVRYTLEYSSLKQEIDWTVIAKDIPVGQNIYRWNIDDVPSSDDYILRVTAKNQSTSCIETSDDPDQIARAFVHNIQIQQSGVFIIDTVPPESVLRIGKTGRVTNQLNQVLSVFSEDATTDVKQIQLRECDVGESLLLGELNVESIEDVSNGDDGEEPDEGEITTEQCPSPTELLAAGRDFDKLITDSPIGNLSKIQWVFDELDSDGNPVSAVKKIEALLTDMGGNTSLQEKTKVFLPIFTDENTINDFIIVVEQREKVVFDGTTTDRESAVYEVVYVGTSQGEFWVLEPYARYIYSLTDHPNILKIFEFNSTIYLFAYNATTDKGAVYRHDGATATLLKEFDSGLGIVTGMDEYGSSLFVGLENGNLWEYNGSAFSIKNSFDEPINTLFGDKKYLYIGFQNSKLIVLYNGTSFIELSIE